MNLVEIKKVLLLSSIFILASILSVLAVNQVNQITAGNMTSSPGATNISIPILMDNNESVAGFQFDIGYTSFLIYRGYQLTSRMPNASVVVNNDTDGVLKIAGLIPEQIAPGNGSILELIFDVNSSAVSGEYPVNFSNLILGNVIAEPVNATPEEAVFTVVSDSDNDWIPDEDDICPLIFGCSIYSGCQYGLKEWLPPITNQENFTLQEASTLPLKFNVTNCSGSFFEDYDVLVKVYNQTLNFYKEYNASGSGDDYIRMNDMLYIVNIHTNELGMPLGNYIIDVSFANNLTNQTGFTLVERGVGKGHKLK